MQMPLGDSFTKYRSGKQISDYARQQGEKREVEGNSLFKTETNVHHE